MLILTCLLMVSCGQKKNDVEADVTDSIAPTQTMEAIDIDETDISQEMVPSTDLDEGERVLDSIESENEIANNQQQTKETTIPSTNSAQQTDPIGPGTGLGGENELDSRV